MTEPGATPPGTSLGSPTELEDTGRETRRIKKAAFRKGTVNRQFPRRGHIGHKHCATNIDWALPILRQTLCWVLSRMHSKDLQSSTGAHSPQHILSVMSLQSPAVHSFLKPDVHYNWISFQFNSFPKIHIYGHLYNTYFYSENNSFIKKC